MKCYILLLLFYESGIGYLLPLFLFLITADTVFYEKTDISVTSTKPLGSWFDETKIISWCMGPPHRHITIEEPSF